MRLSDISANPDSALVEWHPEWHPDDERAAIHYVAILWFFIRWLQLGS